MTLIIQYLSKSICRIAILLLVVILVFAGVAYVSGEWKLYQEARKTDEARWSQLADQNPERVVQEALRLRTPEARIQRLETIIENQRKTNKALSEKISWYHFGWWSSSRRALKAGEMKLEGYITTLELAKKIHSTPVNTSPLFDFIVATVPTALVIVASIIVTPMVIKVLFYYLLAPICQKRPPFRIVQTGSTHSGYKFTPSAVSLPFEVEADEEILLKTEFLQSSSQKAKKRTVWLLNRSIPFSSLLSGMFILTRIRSHDDKPTYVTVSSQRNGLVELGVIDLPDGASLVLHPRSLAGVIKARNKDVLISRHWRLKSLHAWLTLQLRYLVFHGPCRLIVKGQRGIHLERPDQLTARMINQNSTLGFSTTLYYSCTRCETFWSYFLGKDSLFNDHFDGNSGFFVYEEMPGGGAKNGSTRGKLEGTFDTFLKIFGL